MQPPVDYHRNYGHGRGLQTAHHHTLGVRKAYRRRGLGQAMLLHTFRALQQQGIPATYLFVDAANKTGATRLYQRVGMREELEITHYEIELRPGRELAVVD